MPSRQDRLGLRNPLGRRRPDLQSLALTEGLDMFR